MDDLFLLQQRMNRKRDHADRLQARSALAPVVTAGDRDPVTGFRKIESLDGGDDRANKLDNAENTPIPGWYQPGRLGVPSQISSKPA
jgi:hypothetical protein